MEELKKWIRQHLWDQVPISIGVINRDFQIVEANRNFEENYGDWRQRPCYEAYKGRSEPCVDCAALETFEDGRIRVKEEKGRIRDNVQTYYIVHMVPLVRENGIIPYVIEMSTDITTMKTLEKEKLEAERFAAVGQSVSGLAHGIKNLIMGVEGGMYVLKSGLDKQDNQKLTNGWQMLEENVDRISAFTKKLLDFAKERTSKIQLVSPDSLVQGVVELFRAKAKELGTDLECKLGEGLQPAPLDEEGVHACLANLVSNALDACEASEKPGSKVIVSADEVDETLLFEVKDNGTGMDSETQSRIFTKFFTTKGTGLGLMSTRKIAQEHGGRVSFESEEGKGSIFRLEFPRARLPQPTPGKEPKRRNSLPHSEAEMDAES
jgi:signal transduction histidine kinase